MHIHHAGPADHADIEILLDSAFGADRKTRTAYRLREGQTPIPALSFVARDAAGRLIGSIQCWAVNLHDGHSDHRLTLLGPVAIAPDLQRSGVGTALMAVALKIADESGYDALMLIGDVEYYGKFGFTANGTVGWQVPGPVDRHRLLARLTGSRTLPVGGHLRPSTAAQTLAA